MAGKGGMMQPIVIGLLGILLLVCGIMLRKCKKGNGCEDACEVNDNKPWTWPVILVGVGMIGVAYMIYKKSHPSMAGTGGGPMPMPEDAPPVE